MSNVVIKVENLSKQYRLGEIGTGTLSHDLNRWWHRVRGKEDPYLKIGEANDRASKSNSEYVWALQDINFEVKQGEILGIIGKNGAGKSTLLKILSKVTGPTTGSIKAKGRIASLLEVGTGFHPELTGRENIFLNGTILGMSKAEVKKKLDEIVDFAGVARYLDTPVKRYSSGMMVRLGFAVAAHLEPEILIVDEVLAVGDAEFQKKAIGKMQDVSQEGGRTVLFVSHNMTSIKNLCPKVILLSSGRISKIGPSSEIISYYLGHQNFRVGRVNFTPQAKKSAFISEIRIRNRQNEELNRISMDDEFLLVLKFVKKTEVKGLYLHFIISNEDFIPVMEIDSGDLQRNPFAERETGEIEFKFLLPSRLFNRGKYYISMGIASQYHKPALLDSVKDIFLFDIMEGLRQRDKTRSSITSFVPDLL